MLRHLCIASITFLCCHTFADNTPKSQDPYYFVADSVTYLSKAHQITYEGHVKVDQGKTHLTGDKLVIHLTTDNKVKSMVDSGNPATYLTNDLHHSGMIHAKADTITYNQQTDTISLDGNAQVTQHGNRIKAAHITYDKTTGTLRTHGSKAQQTTHITVMPQKLKSQYDIHT